MGHFRYFKWYSFGIADVYFCAFFLSPAVLVVRPLSLSHLSRYATALAAEGN